MGFLSERVGRNDAQTVKEKPCILVQSGLDPEWANIIAAMYARVRTTLMPGEGDATPEIMTGTRQGDCLSGILFCVFLASVTQRVNQSVVELDLAFTLE
eukprot:4084560-Amphidinium_carterae.1